MTGPVVNVKEGKLRGAVQKLYDGSIYFSFKGIPYAQPPVGELRFKAPLPVKGWNNVLDATEHGPVCPQVKRPNNANLKTDENCLFLNVYTRSLQPNTKTAVMVFIHGGGYQTGSGNSQQYGPELLLQHDVVLVTINYKLELFGFLCLDTPEVPGNAGMKDQVEALRWIQRNIKQFGGDPDNVTIFGESAGATSVTYHMLSPMSKGLFHKVIAQSGVCICDWAQGKDSVQRGFRVAKLLGKETNSTLELLDFFRAAPANDFLNKLSFKTLTNDEKYRGLPVTFSPVVEMRYDGVENFLNEEPLKLLMSGKAQKVPVVLGYNSAEAIGITAHHSSIIDFINQHPGYSVPREIARKVPLEQLEAFGKRVKTFYVGDRDYNKNDSQAICDRETDANFIYNTHRFAYIYSKFFDSVYMYRFGCDTELNLAKKISGMTQLNGASHVDDLYYMFSNERVKKIYLKVDNCKRLSDIVTKLWTNFAKTGNPTPDESLGITWGRYTSSNKEYLEIAQQLTVGKFADRERVGFWNALYSEAGLPCITKSSI